VNAADPATANHHRTAAETPARSGGVTRFLGWLRLNRRVAGLALHGRWLDHAAFAAGYDRVAPTYDANWQCRLWPVTERLLEHLPPLPPGPLVDLGCGTGTATRWLAARHPDRPLAGIDVSQGMLAAANRTPPPAGATITWTRADMLAHLRGLPGDSCALVFSAWAIGYSDPARVTAAAARVLVPGGTWAFVVNCADTLAPVFRAFRETMHRFPGAVDRAAVLRFPKGPDPLLRTLRRAGLDILWHDHGHHPIGDPPGGPGAPLLPWLLGTGVLAGFDAMLPLAAPGPVADFFEARLRSHAAREPITHHFAAAVARKP
jgi:trans-aconitate 2-methyltransferase